MMGILPGNEFCTDTPLDGSSSGGRRGSLLESGGKLPTHMDSRKRGSLSDLESPLPRQQSTEGDYFNHT